jgi:hypothetical protein
MSETIVSEYAALPVRRDIRVNRLRSWEERYVVSLSIEDATPQLIDFSEASEAEVRFRDCDATVNVWPLVEAAESGKLTIRLEAAETALLIAGQQDWELFVAFPEESTDFPDGAEIALIAGVATVHNMIE